MFACRMCLWCASAGWVMAQAPGCLIQQDSVGSIHNGMTVAQARVALKGAVLKASEDADKLPILTVIRDGLHTMDLYVDVEQGMKERSKIELIRVYDGACATREGVHPGMPLTDVSKHYGRLKRLRVTDTEMREYAEFERQPGWIEVQVGNGQAGVYPQGKRCTPTASSSAHVASLWVSHPVANKIPEDEAACNVPVKR